MRPSPLLVVLALTGPAFGSPNAALAEVLFREASDAFKEGRVGEACAKFAESHRLDPQRGTLANLARCHEREGKSASAWTDYIALRELARQANDEPRASYAQKRIDEIEPALSRVRIVAAPELGVKEVKLDGVAVGTAALGARFPIDPGAHAVEVTAADRSWTQRIEIRERETTLTLTPPHDALSEGRRPAPARPWQAPLGLALGSIGAASLVVGSALGVLVVVKKGDVDANCAGKTCNAVGFAAQRDAWGLSTGATIALLAGAALLAGGALLFFTAPRAAPSLALRASPGGAILEGRW